MRNLSIILLLSITFILTSCAQNSKQNYQGEWVGFLPNKGSFNFQVSLKQLASNRYHLTLINDKTVIDKNLESSNKKRVQLNVDQQLFLDLEYSQDKQQLTGFIKSGKLLYHIDLKHIGDQKFTGVWNAFMVDNGIQSNDILLYIENMDDGSLAAYPFLGDQRFRGTWTRDFKMKGNTLLFTDGNTGFNFRAKLLESTIDLEILLSNVVITKTSLTHTNDGWEYKTDAIDQSQNTNTPQQLNDGWSTANINSFGIKKNELNRLIDSINANKLVNTHSVLITKKNKLVFENYFGGFNRNIPHDLRSASKSISSAIIGIAIDDKIIKNVDEPLYDFVPKDYQYTKDELKATIKIKDLLTMSSGLDVNNLASEDYYQDPSRTKNWLQTVLEAPMVKKPGTYADYGSANPFLLGICLNERLKKPLEFYMQEKLFGPLGIINYINQTDDTQITPYFGGGMLLTSRDLLKFGQLYLNGGQWNGKQIISEHWVAESFKKRMRLQDSRDKNEYGYLWWHDTYIVNEKAIKSIEARGAGGQFIFIIPELEAVVVITSGNFRNRKGNQPRKILKEYILPAMIN
ncbi:class C beta-lactamase-related serine hydrolase [Aquimarina sp. AD10]|uniref:serine hydrolase domain-containing protein n=1 Tax=Aquimarina sp. AD10 TaxID=1714849 RepID=UPI000E505422|nr:serine hydrolase [Aquimarina sp. AD10]AXT63352.1 class C beta-lactamase-related serine hydrolase [Aquimarina sp. AD10]RKN00635.1 class C beta-lactamase-related serine hydrolase [Aquimarina sp. AD10]